MRPHLRNLVLLGLAGGAAVYLYDKRRAAARYRRAFDVEPADIPDTYDVDPRDILQVIDEISPLHSDELLVDAMSDADAEGELELAEVETQLEGDDDALEPASRRTLEDIERGAHDVGDLYGIHMPRATDREHRDDDAAFANGQHWLEALEEDAAEGGPEPERGVGDVVDDEDVYDPPHASDHRDRPVADRGSGGPGGI